MDRLTKSLKAKALSLGAQVAGIASPSAFEGAPEGHRPRNVLKEAQAVVSLGFLQPRAVVEKALSTQYTRNIFTAANLADQQPIPWPFGWRKKVIWPFLFPPAGCT